MEQQEERQNNIPLAELARLAQNVHIVKRVETGIESKTSSSTEISSSSQNHRKHAEFTFGTMKIPFVMPLWKKLDELGFDVTEVEKEKVLNKLVKHWEIRFRSISHRDDIILRLKKRITMERVKGEMTDSDMQTITWMNQYINNFNHETHIPRRREYMQITRFFIRLIRHSIDGLKKILENYPPTSNPSLEQIDNQEQLELLEQILPVFDIFMDLTRRKVYLLLRELKVTPWKRMKHRAKLMADIEHYFSLLLKTDPHHQILYCKIQEEKRRTF